MRIKIFLSLVALLIIFWVTLPSKKVKIIFCDVGQGDALLAIYQNQQLLIDTGPNNKKILSCLEDNIPFWDKKIETVMITHGDNDHSGGLADVSRYYQIEQIIDSKKVSQFDLVKNNWMIFEVVNPDKKPEIGQDNNQNSVAGILKCGGLKIFMAGDIDTETEQRLVWQKILREEVDVLKVSHHGSKNGTSKELLNILKPKLAVISVGEKNSFGHPTKEVLDRLKENGIKIERTDEVGNVAITDLDF